MDSEAASVSGSAQPLAPVSIAHANKHLHSPNGQVPTCIAYCSPVQQLSRRMSAIGICADLLSSGERTKHDAATKHTYAAIATRRDRPQDLFLRACRGEALTRVPVWMMRQAGRYLPGIPRHSRQPRVSRGLQNPGSGRRSLSATLSSARRGCRHHLLRYFDPRPSHGHASRTGGRRPKSSPSQSAQQRDVAKLRSFDPEIETAFLPEAIRRIAKSVGPDVPVLGFAAAPWTLACYMVEGKAKEGFSTVKSFLYHQPDSFRALLTKIAAATIPYLNAQIAAGAAAVQLFDTWCGELSLGDYQEFALPATQEIISGLDGSTPVIYYTKASSSP